MRTGCREKKTLRRLTDTDFLKWKPTAAEDAAIAVDSSILRPNHPIHFSTCHSRTSPHGVSKLASRDGNRLSWRQQRQRQSGGGGSGGRRQAAGDGIDERGGGSTDIILCVL